MDLRKKAILFTASIAPFVMYLGLFDFVIGLKYDVVLENLLLLGAVISSAWIFSSLFVLAIGDLTDKIGFRKTICVGVALASFGAILFSITNNLLIMSIGTFLWGVAYSAVMVPAEAFILSRFPKNYRGSAYGLYYFLFDLVYGSMPLIAFFIIMVAGLDSVMMFAAFIVLTTIFFLSRLRFIDYMPSQSLIAAIKEVVTNDKIIGKEIKDIKKMGVKEISLFFNMFIFGFWFVTIMLGAPLLFFHGEANLWNAALLATAFMLPFSIMDFCFGRFCNSHSSRLKIIIFGLGGTAILLFTFFFVDNFILLLLIASLSTITLNAAWFANEVHISEFLPRGKKGEYVGIYSFPKDIGFDIAPLFYGAFAAFGLKVPFFILSFLLAFGFAFFVIAHFRN